MPISPTKCAELRTLYANDNVMNLYGYTKSVSNRKPFVTHLHESSQFSYCVFSSEKSIDLMLKYIPVGELNFLIDATFKVCPFGVFKQMLIIYIEYMSKVQTKYILLHPDTKYFACWFHFTQACKRKCKSIPRFEALLKKDKEFYTVFSKFLHLPLLRSDMITDQFNLLKHESLTVNRVLFEPFITYFQRQWIQLEEPQKISVFGRKTRTTSSVEAYNNALRNKIETNGHFFRFVRTLQNTEYEKSRDFALLFQNGGAGNEQIRKKYRVRNKRIMDAMNKLQNDILKPSEFLSLVVSYNDKFSKENMLDFVDSSDESDDHENHGSLSQASTLSALSHLSPKSSESSLPSTSSSSSYTNTPRKCVICFERDLNVVLLPCKHFRICEVCYEALKIENQQKKKNE